jgi:hypothetical protein
MYEELKKWYDKTKPNLKIHGPDDISKWNYSLPDDNTVPEGLKLYKIWRGGDVKKGNAIRTIGNHFLRWYFDRPNIHVGIYADLRRWIDGDRDGINWMKL